MTRSQLLEIEGERAILSQSLTHAYPYRSILLYPVAFLKLFSKPLHQQKACLEADLALCFRNNESPDRLNAAINVESDLFV